MQFRGFYFFFFFGTPERPERDLYGPGAERSPAQMEFIKSFVSRRTIASECAIMIIIVVIINIMRSEDVGVAPGVSRPNAAGPQCGFDARSCARTKRSPPQLPPLPRRTRNRPHDRGKL